MSQRLDQNAAEYHAKEVHQEFSISAFPIDPFEIAKQNEIKLQEMTVTEGVSGVLMRSGYSFTIGYNTAIQSAGFQRFTVAHELGHYYLPGHPDNLFPLGNGRHESQAGFSSSDQWERQADCFAAALLMPSVLFQEALRDAGEGLPAIESMARLCQTSLTATAIRYAAFTEDPVVVVLSDGKKILYSGASDPIQGIVSKRDLWLRDSVAPPRSCTADLGKAAVPSAQHRKEGYSLLSEWIDGAPDIEMKEDAISLGDYGRILTVLFSEEPLPDEDDEY